MAHAERQQCEHCGASMTDVAAYQKHMAEHEPAGRLAGGQTAPGPEDQTEAAERARERLAQGGLTPGGAERVHDEARR